MKKVFEWLTGGVVKDIGGIIDNLTTTKEEKLRIKKEIEEVLIKAHNEAANHVTDRWKSDMVSDSWLSKNIRPLVLIFLTVVFTILAFFDGNIGGFKVAEAYVPIYQSLLITVYGAYFVGRTWEKNKKSGNNN